MYCCLLSSRTSSIINTQNEEKKSLLTSGTIVNYRTVLSIPYAHVIRDDTIKIDPSNVDETNASDSLLFNGTMPDRTCKTQSFPFDDDNTSSVVLTTPTTNDQCLLERLFSVNNVSAVNSSRNLSMSSTKSKKTSSSNAVPMARPFDEFITDITIKPVTSLDGENSSMTTKSDKD